MIKKIGLIDAELMWQHKWRGRYGNQKSDIFPNLPLMKLSTFHKSEGDQVEWYNPMGGTYDRVYVSKVFADTPISNERINAKQVILGGTGFQIRNINGREIFGEPNIPSIFKNYLFSYELDHKVEHSMPDYSLYPMIQDTAIGFLTRGCPRRCPFCHVGAKEGPQSYQAANLTEWWSGQKNIILCDPNILAAEGAEELLKQLADSKAKVDINQGMDARLITPEIVDILNEIKLKTIHFAWDNYNQKEMVLKGLKIFADGFRRKMAHQAQVFVLTNYDTTPEQDLERIYTLRDMGFEPYIMIYNKKAADPFYKSLQRWVNQRAIFHKIERFEDYDKTLAKE